MNKVSRKALSIKFADTKSRIRNPLNPNYMVSLSRVISGSKLRLLLVFTALLFSSASLLAQPNGEILFKGNCASCHRPTEEPLTGPGLKGARERWAGREELLYQWIKNPQKVLNSGDAYANELYKNWKSSGVMPAQAVNNEEIDAILDYVEAYQPPVAAAGPVEAEGGEATSADTDTTWYVLTALLALILVIAIFSLAGARRAMAMAVAREAGKEYDGPNTYADAFRLWVRKNQLLVIFLIVVALVAVLREGWYGLSGVGVYEGYKPEQPIWFSHKVHAGQNQINCVYCHNSAEKSKHAGIPTANICMNCHTAVAKGKITGEKEINKIYAAVGWDKETRSYTGETQPIKWVKVHNLPDHVYFNHSQHVVVGEIECQECHGEVEKMDVAQQHAPLTMGWCINCHRETEVKMADNGYYDEIHNRLTPEELKKYLNGDEQITASELGGIECAKCHY
ncbi:c-type cytochrome [Luteibaculum oceani]|uniref:C-type cytochrome n=1 Tax=Luteibaculum oceani TaxID=1294296 RepID=A0A5C6VL54_9FLAO|nr:c-type cytochrome [Luteibaculum oceani]TXC85076.1 c-type cytochrome [Luteibaculum oceani]